MCISYHLKYWNSSVVFSAQDSVVPFAMLNFNLASRSLKKPKVSKTELICIILPMSAAESHLKLYNEFLTRSGSNFKFSLSEDTEYSATPLDLLINTDMLENSMKSGQWDLKIVKRMFRFCQIQIQARVKKNTYFNLTYISTVISSSTVKIGFKNRAFTSMQDFELISIVIGLDFVDASHDFWASGIICDGTSGSGSGHFNCK